MGILPDDGSPFSEQVRELADQYVREAERQRDTYKASLDRLRERHLALVCAALSIGLLLGIGLGILFSILH